MAEFKNNHNNCPIYKGPLYMCCFCKMMFISEEYLKKHHKKCIEMKMMIILKCKLQIKSNQANSNSSLQQRKKPNNESEDYFCEECFCGFLKLSEYNRHKRHHHHHLQNNYHCNDSNNISSNENNIYITNKFYFKSPTQSKQFQCNLCSKTFSAKSLLTRHFRCHTGERPFACPHCPSKFTDQGNLKQHLVTHTGLKPYVCPVCSMKFSVRCNLKVHLMTHTGEKPFECEQCPSRFAKKWDLKRHSTKHSGEKAFGCDMCPARFSNKSNLIVHIRRHTGERTNNKRRTISPNNSNFTNPLN